jgi:hypothetical protein
LWILARWLLEKKHFQPFQVHEREVKIKNKKTMKEKKEEKRKNQTLT